MTDNYVIIEHCHLCDAENVPGIRSTTVRGVPATYCQVCWEMSLSPVHSVGKATSAEHYIAVALSKLARRLLYEPKAAASVEPDPMPVDMTFEEVVSELAALSLKGENDRPGTLREVLDTVIGDHKELMKQYARRLAEEPLTPEELAEMLTISDICRGMTDKKTATELVALGEHKE